MYHFIEEDSQRDILTAADIWGFFVDPSVGVSDSITAVGSAWNSQKLPLLIEDVELQVKNTQEEEIGYYYIGTIEVTDAVDSETMPGSVDLTMSFGGYAVPYPYAGEIWKRWARGGRPNEPGVWKKLPAEAHESWLHVVQTTWFRSGHRAIIYGDCDRYRIEGADLANIHSFYCELGEAANGPGGYLGSNPNALEDCLINSDIRGRPPLCISWRNFETSQRTIDDDELDYVLTVLRQCGVGIEYPHTD